MTISCIPLTTSLMFGAKLAFLGVKLLQYCYSYFFFPTHFTPSPALLCCDLLVLVTSMPMPPCDWMLAVTVANPAIRSITCTGWTWSLRERAMSLRWTGQLRERTRTAPFQYIIHINSNNNIFPFRANKIVCFWISSVSTVLYSCSSLPTQDHLFCSGVAQYVPLG